MEDVFLAKRDPTRKFAVELTRSCHDDNCSDALLLDLRGVSPITDYFVIATGSSDRQIRAVVTHLVDLAKAQQRRPIGLDGADEARWVLIDFADVVVHVFSPEFRQLYELELLWGDAPRVRWQRRPARQAATRGG